uniref:SAM-dependent MTase RsmB/NOP-type domain-containing protein n=1 Tax=Kalanchoe fedtschenkoi TaxID=63787 RepID=A0A7N0V677_KALFE
MGLKRGAETRPPADNEKSSKPRQKLSNADRSAYFARRESAKVLRSVLQGDARRQAVASIKSLVFGPAVRNKKATFALVCQTLKHLPIIKEVLETADVLTGKWKRQLELVYIIVYDILFGQENSLVGDAEKFLVLRKNALQTSLARLLVKKKVSSVDHLLALYQIKDIPKPRYVRVNTLKLDVESAIQELSKCNEVHRDELVPDLLVLPPGSDLHDHPLVTNGSLLLQGKASSMVALALAPNPRWMVLDACAAPGNKTVHMAALMRGEGKIIACELNEGRAKRLENTIKLSGANNIEILQGDFLSLDPSDLQYSKVRAILLDPSCSGSGTVSDRLDHLLPSFAEGNNGSSFADIQRLNKLSAFQKKALSHALSFPEVERVVYSTCSINQAENEDVVASVLPLAASNGFHLETALPRWPRRGLPVIEGYEHLVRTDPIEDKEGFFIALFVRKPSTATHLAKESESHQRPIKKPRTRNGTTTTKLSYMLLQNR